MLVLSFCLGIIFLVLCMISYRIYNDHYKDHLKNKKVKLFLYQTRDLWCALAIVCVFAFFIIGMIAGLEYQPKITEKIAIYEQENQQIEEQMATLVEDYMEFELGVIKECKPEDAMTLVTLYPTLTSSTLVSKQMETYTQNMYEIKTLKSQELTQEVIRWWLYFGD